MGPRRVGKTVLIHHVIQGLVDVGVQPVKICYVSVDHPLYNGCSLHDLLARYQEVSGIATLQGCYVFFDEIQYLRDWEVHLKTLVDSHPEVKFVASGSAAAALRMKSQESGAGRFTDFMLPPLTFHEYLELIGQQSLVEPIRESPYFLAPNIRLLNEAFLSYLNYGGYPEVAVTPAIQADPGRFIKNDIIDKVLLRDLPSLYGIQDIQELNYLFTTLAFNTAGEVSLDELSQNSGVAKNTIKKYIEYLEAAFLIKVVHRIDRTARRFQRANFFKVYLTNPSIRSALFAPIAEDDPAIGHVVETGIYAQWFHSRRLLYYARWANGEVDIVGMLPKHTPAWAAEVKYTDRFYGDPYELKSLMSFIRENSLTRAVVTTREKQGVHSMEGCTIEFIPASLYCYIIGRNAVVGAPHPSLPIEPPTSVGP
jgi:predicted AAA+ superfamily ATPase